MTPISHADATEFAHLRPFDVGNDHYALRRPHALAEDYAQALYYTVPTLILTTPRGGRNIIRIDRVGLNSQSDTSIYSAIICHRLFTLDAVTEFEPNDLMYFPAVATRDIFDFDMRQLLIDLKGQVEAYRKSAGVETPLVIPEPKPIVLDERITIHHEMRHNSFGELAEFARVEIIYGRCQIHILYAEFDQKTNTRPGTKQHTITNPEEAPRSLLCELPELDANPEGQYLHAIEKLQSLLREADRSTPP